MQIRSKKENAEKIWQEIQRRQSQKDNKATKKKKKRSKLTQSTSKKDMTGKQKKRLSALEELMIDDDNDDEPAVVESAKQTTEDAAEESTTNSSDEGGGIFGKIQGFYEKADNMAASQALLLNKELEDRGVIDKITDETGLKVIGKEAASKLDSNKDAEGK